MSTKTHSRGKGMHKMEKHIGGTEKGMSSWEGMAERRVRWCSHAVGHRFSKC